jgi:hypothetical protein
VPSAWVAGAQRANLNRPLSPTGRHCDRLRAGAVFDDSEPPPATHPLGGAAAPSVDPVGSQTMPPADASAVSSERRPRALRRERLRLQRRCGRACGGRRLDAGLGISDRAGGGDDRDRPVLGLGLGNQPVDHARALRPAGGRRPAVVDDDHHRAAALERGLAIGIEHRIGERQETRPPPACG